MATERPPGVVSSSASKSLARTGLTSRTMVRKTGPRPCNLPSMKKSNISDSNHVEIVPPGSTGWAKTPKPVSDDGNTASNSTWTVPQQVSSEKIPSLKTPAETRSADPTKASLAKVPETKGDGVHSSSSAPSSSSSIDNPFGVDINVTSWAREVSPPPSARKAWSDASPMDFSKPVIFEQHAAANSSAASAPRSMGPLPENAFRPAVVRKPTVSSILKKPDSERHPPPAQVSESTPTSKSASNSKSAPSLDQTETVAPSLQKPAAAPAVDETVQAMTMKQKAEEAMRRRQEQEKLREEQVRARLAEKLAALEKKSAASKQMPAPISVMQRPKDAASTTAAPANAVASPTSSIPSIKSPAKDARCSSTCNAPSAAAVADVKVQNKSSPSDSRTMEQVSLPDSRPVQTSNIDRSCAEQVPEQQISHSDSTVSGRQLQDESKSAQSHRRDRRHGHRRHHHDAPGSKLPESRSWARPSAIAGDDRDVGQPSSERSTKEGERSEPIPERDAAPLNMPSRDSRRREDRSKRSAKGSSKTQQPQGPSSGSVIQTEPNSDLQPRSVPLHKAKSSHGHRKWRAKESASPVSSAGSTPVPSPVEPVSAKPTVSTTETQEKPTEVPAVPASSLGRAPRQWKSSVSEAQSETDKKRHRAKRSGGRRPDPFRNVFENDPVVGSEAGTLMWSAAAPVIGSTSAVPPSSGGISAPRSWSTPKPSKSHNAQLLTQQQSRIKKSIPGSSLAARVLANTLAASRST